MSGSDEFYYQGQEDDRLRTEEEAYFTYLLPRLVEHLREINAELLAALEKAHEALRDGRHNTATVRNLVADAIAKAKGGQS